jgi:hypothetical protein
MHQKAPFVLYVLLPLSLNFPLGIIGFLIKPAAFSGAVGLWICYIVAGIATAAASVSFFALCRHYVGAYRTLLGLGGQAIALILVFAGIYRGYGLKDHAAIIDAATGLYFSIVTWTTLGYGDLSPAEGIRLLAALQALLGYIFLGVIVGIATGMISGKEPMQGQPAEATQPQATRP